MQAVGWSAPAVGRPALRSAPEAVARRRLPPPPGAAKLGARG
jgi:hypothetical protein